MPEIDTMFERRHLSPHDFNVGTIYVATIRDVTIKSMTMSASGPGYAQPVAAPDWLMWFHEYKKPMYLKTQTGHQIASVLRLNNTDHWPGHRIGWYVGMKTVGSEKKLGFFIDQQPVAPGQMRQGAAPPPQLSSGMAPAALPGAAPGRYTSMYWDGTANPSGVLSAASLESFIVKCREHRKTWVEFLAWLMPLDTQAHAQLLGRPMGSIPSAAALAMKAFIASLEQPTPPAATRTNGQYAHPEVVEIQEEDIPF